MHMYGIDPPVIQDPIKIDQQYTDRSNDVDIVVPAIYRNDLLGAKKTPSGLAIERKPPVSPNRAPLVMHVLQFSAENHPNLFPADIITGFSGETRKDAIKHDAKLKQIHEKHSHIIPGTDIRVLSLGRIAAVLDRRSLDPKAAADLQAIKFAYRQNLLPGKK